MRAARNSLFLFLVSLLVFGVVSRVSDAKPYPRPHPHPRPQPQPQGLTMNFYSESCKNAEDIVRKITRSRVRDNQALAAKLLRTHYHDCFVRVGQIHTCIVILHNENFDDIFSCMLLTLNGHPN